MPLRRLSAAIVVTALATACLETHAPPEQGLIAPPAYSDVLVNAAGGIGPVVLLEGGTGTHVVYVAELFPDYGGAYPLAYAGCAGLCDVSRNWKSGVFDSTLSTVPPAATLTRGALHVVYPVYGPIGSTQQLRYGVCRAGCNAPANWQRAIIDTATDMFAALAADSAGALHAAYERVDGTGRTLRYANCTADCTTATNWVGVAADTGLPSQVRPALAIQGGGRMHAAYTAYVPETGAWLLRYGTCAAGCTSTGAWSFVTLDTASFSPPTLVLRHGATVYLSYASNDSVARIGRCLSACASRSSWDFVSLPGFGVWPKLAIGPDEAMHLVGQSRARLQYGRCVDACDVASDWQVTSLPVGTVSSAGLAIDPTDQPRVAYALVFDALRMALFK